MSATAQVDNTEEPLLDTANLVGPTPTTVPTVSIPALLATTETQHLNNVSAVQPDAPPAHQTLSAQAVLQASTTTH